MKTENKTTLSAFLSDLNYAIDLTATDLDSAKNDDEPNMWNDLQNSGE